jgi:hypothetical protein
MLSYAKTPFCDAVITKSPLGSSVRTKLKFRLNDAGRLGRHNGIHFGRKTYKWTGKCTGTGRQKGRLARRHAGGLLVTTSSKLMDAKMYCTSRHHGRL